MRDGLKRSVNYKNRRITVSDGSPLKGTYRVKNASVSAVTDSKKGQQENRQNNIDVKSAAAFQKLKSDKRENVFRNTKKIDSQSAENNSPTGNFPNSAYERAAMLQSRMQSEIDFSRKEKFISPSENVNTYESELRQQRVQKSFYLSANKEEIKKTIHSVKERTAEHRKTDSKPSKNDKKKYSIKKEKEKFAKHKKNKEKISSVVKNALGEKETYTELLSSASNSTTGEAAADIAKMPLKTAGREILKKTVEKNSGANSLLTAANIYATAERENSSADNIGEATVNKLNAVSKAVVSEKIKKNVSLTNENNFRKQQDKKRENLRRQLEKSKKRTAARRAEHMKREFKINLYKSEHGIASKGNTLHGNVRALAKQFADKFNRILKVKSSAAVAAAAGSFASVMVIFVIVILLISVFSWMKPHSQQQYNDEENIWETVELSKQREVLEGYLKHIQQYFDRKQLAVLETVDYNFGGFEPDKYCYTKSHFQYRKVNVTNVIYVVNCKATHSWSWNDGHGHGGGGSEVNETTSDHQVCQVKYYYFDKQYGEFQTIKDNAEYARVYMTTSIDIESYYSSLHENYPALYPECTFENGKLSQGQDITDLQIIQKDIHGNILNIDYAYNYLCTEGSLAVKALLNQYFTNDTTEGLNNGVTYVYTLSEINISDTDPMVQNPDELLDDCHIWSLYEYGNKWIKLSDDCDLEHIIAMTAVMKWQEIENGSVDPNSYIFNITESDLDICMNGIYEFYYSYRLAPCAAKNCHRTAIQGGFVYSCCRPSSHKHLIGQVTNYEKSYGIDFVLKKILKIPVPDNYASEEEYNTALGKYKTDCDIYNAYCGFISSILGTSTKLDDYENDRRAQERLREMHEAVYGKIPDQPVNVSVTLRVVTVPPDDDCSFNEHSHNKITVAWDPPAGSQVTGYNVYVYSRNYSKTICQVYQTSSSFIDIDLGQAYNRLSDKYIVVSAYNEVGENPPPPHNPNSGIKVTLKPPNVS
ncbi:MAG: fibronectin type III domain-containing protein [Ruminococcus sp.]|nr:fibronectin type III domain-containing protein [Ruminococcus sp.]